ncbi:MAG: hypothetical protein JXA21_04700 [Anaerolineae bacterium]|nr:hypothetical protein [Anaerolineae bacterium]
MSWQQALIRLQEIDLEFQTINQRLGEIETLLKDQTEIHNAEQAVNTKIKAASNAKKIQEELEFELSKTQNKLQQTERQLYGGSVTNARELQDLQTEAETLRRRIASLENDLLSAMDVQEETDSAVTSAQNHLRDLQSQWEEQHQHLLTEREEQKKRGNVLMEELQGVKKQIPPAILDAYRYLKDRTGGLPVARLKGNMCSRCGVEVSMPTERQANRGEEAYCDGCHRLIVV